MNTPHIATKPDYYQTIPMIDIEFDQFEFNHDLEASLPEAETAHFYMGAFNPQD